MAANWVFIPSDSVRLVNALRVGMRTAWGAMFRFARTAVAIPLCRGWMKESKPRLYDNHAHPA
jgi:hypothetical protein